MRYLLISMVGGVHVAVIGGVLLMQGCGTTRGPMALPDSPPMPPAMAAEDLPPPVHPIAPYKPVTIDAAASAALVAPTRPVPPAPAKPAPVADDGRTYVVGKGDSLSVIAKRHGVTVTELMLLNNISDPNRIRLGQKLKLPAASATPAVAAPKPSAAAPSAVPAGSGRYEVKSGDSLSTIAQRHGTTVKALQEVNGLKNDRIMIGQKLVLPAESRTPAAASSVHSAPKAEALRSAVPTPTVERPVVPAVPAPEMPTRALVPDPVPQAPAAASRNSYTVQVGDDILTVASQHNVSISDLRRANQLTSDTLIPGQTLIIPSAE